MRAVAFLPVLLALTLSGRLAAQQYPFSYHPAGLPAFGYSASAWGDFDNDGDLDLALTGTVGNDPATRIYRNDGGTLTDLQAGLQPLHYGSVEWGDCDTDGDLDLLATGIDAQGTPHAILFTNTAGTFSNSGILLPGVMDGQATFGDLDNDGLPDILIAGSGMAKIFRNGGNGVFTDLNASLPGVEAAACCWTDYDSDGRQDVMICGNTGGGIISALYRNDQGTFVPASLDSTFYGLYGGQVKWADFDCDGDPDVAIAGMDLYVDGYFILYRNEGEGVFTRVDYPAANLLTPFFDISDYNADGLPDLLLIGASPGCGGPPLTMLLENQGDFSFSLVSTLIPGFKLGSAAWGDFNGDGYSDLVIAGLDGNDVAHTSLYLNNLGDTSVMQVNTPPGIPGGLTATMEGDRAVLRWNRTTDSETPSASLTYNLAVGTTPGGHDILSPLADAGSGFRRLAMPGNSGSDTAVILSGINAGNYYFTVQAVDAGFLPGLFSSPFPFIFTTVGMEDDHPESLRVYPNPCRDRLAVSDPEYPETPRPVRIYNTLGSIVWEGPAPALLDVSDWPAGIYVAGIMGEHTFRVTRILRH